MITKLPEMLSTSSQCCIYIEGCRLVRIHLVPISVGCPTAVIVYGDVREREKP